MVLVGLLSIIGNVAASPIDDAVNSIKDAVMGFANSLFNMLKNIAGSITSAITSAITAPFTYLQSAFWSSYQWLQSYAGPLAPLIMVLIGGMCILIVVWVFKRVLNTITS